MDMNLARPIKKSSKCFFSSLVIVVVVLLFAIWSAPQPQYPSHKSNNKQTIFTGQTKVIEFHIFIHWFHLISRFVCNLWMNGIGACLKRNEAITSKSSGALSWTNNFTFHETLTVLNADEHGSVSVATSAPLGSLHSRVLPAFVGSHERQKETHTHTNKASIYFNGIWWNSNRCVLTLI